MSAWADERTGSVGKYRALIAEMKGSGDIDFAMLALAVNEVHKLLGSVRAPVVPTEEETLLVEAD